MRGLNQVRYHDEPVSFDSYGAYATSSTGTPPQFDDSRFPPNLTFVEVLRGYALADAVVCPQNAPGRCFGFIAHSGSSATPTSGSCK